MPLINCKVELSLNWIENCVLSTAQTDANADNTGADSATFKTTDAQLYVPIVILSAEDNAKLSKLLSEEFKRSIYWNTYKVIENTVVEIATYGQSINDSIKQYDEISKISTGQGGNYTTGCLLDFNYFGKKYRLIAADLSKQKALDADSRAIQQIIFTSKIKSSVAKIRVVFFNILEQSKEAMLEFAKKRTTKVL